MNQVDQVDVVIIGGGPVGLATAAGLSQAGFQVAIVERDSWVHQPPDGIETRVSAINEATMQWFDALGVTEDLLQQRHGIYRNMSVWDEATTASLTLTAESAHVSQLGWIIENGAMQAILYQRLQKSAALTYDQTKIQAIEPLPPNGQQRWQIKLDNGVTLKTPLIVGCDGALSMIRQHMGIDIAQQDYQHQALVATVATQKPHHYTAYQRFLHQGVLAFLPLADQHHCSIVWSQTPQATGHCANLDQTALNQAIAGALEYQLGPVRCLSSRLTRFPLIARHAKRYGANGVVLLGDAAHTIHPLAGQGVNLGFQDGQCFVDVLTQAKAKRRDYAAMDTIDQFERQRRWHNQQMLMAMRGIKTLFCNDDPFYAAVRQYGMKWINQSTLLKRVMIQQAMTGGRHGNRLI